MAGPVYRDVHCESWMATVSNGRSGVLRWTQWDMAESVYLTTVGHGRTCVPRWPLWVMAGSVYRDGHCESW
ncbi:hypothetical protein J6590_079254 [Homalodisca vitripennis]|nr:hypothetical protein J6590_079254 [Homalodisca vitripennis]